MKYLLVIALFVMSFTANAAEIAYANNNAGGRIVLTNNVCTIKGQTYKHLYYAYNYASNGQALSGCYVLDDSTVRVLWEDGDERRYPVSMFTIVNKGPST